MAFEIGSTPRASRPAWIDPSHPRCFAAWEFERTKIEGASI